DAQLVPAASTDPAPRPVMSPDVDAPAPSKRRPTIGPRGASISQYREEFRMSVGVLTDPRSLAEYEQVVPGYGAKILDKFFEQVAREQEHRHALEREAMQVERAHDERTLRQGDRGQWMALTVALVVFVLVGVLAFLTYPWLAGVIGSLDLLALVS